MNTYFDELGNEFEVKENNMKEVSNMINKNELGFLNAGIFQSLEQQANMGVQLVNQMKEMYYSMVNVKDEVKYLKEDVNSIKNDVVEIAKDVMDNVYLSQAQYSELYNIVHEKTIETIRDIYGDLDSKLFNKAFRIIVMRFWKLIKRHCDRPAKACQIKRKDYEKAIKFAKGLNVSTFVASYGKYGVPSLV